MKRIAPAIMLLALVALAPQVAHADELAHDPDAKRVLFTGDSITQGKPIDKSGGYSYRYFTWKRFESAGTAQTVDFVGNKVAPYVDLTPLFQDPARYADPNFDYEHAGVAGAELCKPDGVTGQLPIADLMAAYDPHVIAAAWGINDLRRGTSPVALIGCYDRWLDDIRAHNPDADVVVARLPWVWADADVPEFNRLLSAWGANHDTAASRVIVTVMAETYSPFDTYDGLHPNAGGEQKVAGMMASGLRALGFSLHADPILRAPATPGLVVVRQGRYIVVKWSARPRASEYVVRCRGVDRKYRSARVVRYNAPAATACRVRATNNAGASRWSGAVVAPAPPL